MEEWVLGNFAMVKLRLKSDEEDETSASEYLEVVKDCPGEWHHGPFCSDSEDATEAQENRDTNDTPQVQKLPVQDEKTILCWVVC